MMIAFDGYSMNNIVFGFIMSYLFGWLSCIAVTFFMHNSKKPSVKDRTLLDDVNFFLRWIAGAFGLYFAWAIWSLAHVKGWV